MSKASKLIACLLNVSEARNSQLIENIAKAAISTNSPTTDFKCDSVVLNIFSDKIYNRSVISIGGKFNSLIKAKLLHKKLFKTEIDLNISDFCIEKYQFRKYKGKIDSEK